MAVYFISDLHLEPAKPALAEGFIRFLNTLQDAEALYILGDFFEVWIGDDVENPFVSQIKEALKALSNRDIKLFLMHGNRDFLLGKRFCEETGATLLNDPATIQLGGDSALLMHGDSLCTLDTAYMQARQMLRSSQWQQQFLAKTIPERIAFARQVRSESQTGNQMKSADIMDVTPDEVDRIMTEHHVSLMIHGHTHRPFDHHWQHNGESRRRIVLGDWNDDSGWMIRWSNDRGFTLEQFEF